MTGVMQSEGSSNLGVDLSEAARTHLLGYLKQQVNCKGIRLSLKKTGCSGLSYVVDYITESQVDDVTLPFDQDYQIYVDKKSYPYLKGLQIDYVKQGLNQKLIFNNPNQTGQCGCGESFTVE